MPSLWRLLQSGAAGRGIALWYSFIDRLGRNSSNIVQTSQTKINITMKRIETRVLINARPEQVWSTLTDFEAYPDWNPFIVKLKGKPVVGTTLGVHLKLGNKTPQVFKPKVLVAQRGGEFRWRGKLFVRGLFDGEHYFKLRPLKDGQTELTHGEQFSGLLAGLIMRMIHAETVQGFGLMNRALRARVEAVVAK
jgi:hypothetical protein